MQYKELKMWFDYTLAVCDDAALYYIFHNYLTVIQYRQDGQTKAKILVCGYSHAQKDSMPLYNDKLLTANFHQPPVPLSSLEV